MTEFIRGGFYSGRAETSPGIAHHYRPEIDMHVFWFPSGAGVGVTNLKDIRYIGCSDDKKGGYNYLIDADNVEFLGTSESDKVQVTTKNQYTLTSARSKKPCENIKLFLFGGNDELSLEDGTQCEALLGDGDDFLAATDIKDCKFDLGPGKDRAKIKNFTKPYEIIDPDPYGWFRRTKDDFSAWWNKTKKSTVKDLNIVKDGSKDALKTNLNPTRVYDPYGAFSTEAGAMKALEWQEEIHKRAKTVIKEGGWSPVIPIEAVPKSIKELGID